MHKVIVLSCQFVTCKHKNIFSRSTRNLTMVYIPSIHTINYNNEYDQELMSLKKERHIT